MVVDSIELLQLYFNIETLKNLSKMLLYFSILPPLFSVLNNVIKFIELIKFFGDNLEVSCMKYLN